MKRFICFLLAFVLCVATGMPVYATEDDAASPASESATEANQDEDDEEEEHDPGQTWFTAQESDTGIIDVTYNEPMAGKLVYTVYYDGEIVTTGDVELKGNTTAQVGLPVNRLPYKKYQVTVAYYNNDNRKIAEDTLAMTLGCDTPVLSSTNLSGGEIKANPIEQTKAIMVPYAKVFSNSTLTGTPVVELKRHDIVQVNSISNGIASIKYMVQSGNGQLTVQDDVNTLYTSDDDLVGYGYVNTNVFEAPELSYESDIQREVVELAYSRLGSKGVYSQARRYQDYYLDCAALCCWAWHQVGVNPYSGAYTSCGGISSWAFSQPSSNNVILWAATEDYTSALMAISEIKAAHDIEGSITFDGGQKEENVLNYMDNISRDVWESLEPGDIILFNWKEDLTYNGIDFGSYWVNDYGPHKGFDHAALVVGFSSDGEGGENKDVLTYIETANPDENTKVSSISFSAAQETIRAIVRPTGCKRMDPSGIMSSQYTGTYYSDIGDLKAPLAGYVAGQTTFTNGCQFGYRSSPVGNGYEFHSGIDINGGNVPGVGYGSDVMAAGDGEVIFVSNTCPHYMPGAPICSCGGTYGNYIIIQHNDKTKTLYAHLKPDIEVSAGQKVKAGDVIAHVGTSGSSTGPHLHFEVRYNDTPTNPVLYIK